MAIQQELLEEFLGADAYLFAVPMYNLTMPSVFKAWLDQIMVDGHTLSFDGHPPTLGRPAVLISARGGYGPATPSTAWITWYRRWKPSWVTRPHSASTSRQSCPS
jgi:FMN-dependent NADH-azoreductase